MTRSFHNEVCRMAQLQQVYSPVFPRQMVGRYRAGRAFEGLAEEFG